MKGKDTLELSVGIAMLVIFGSFFWSVFLPIGGAQ